MKQTILVTGASSGFGLHIANKLPHKGFHVIGTSRNPEQHQEKVPFKLLALDVTDELSVESFGKKLFSQIKQLDVLINNAGFYLSGLAEETSIEQGKKQLETNFWGTVKLTNELLPYFSALGVVDEVVPQDKALERAIERAEYLSLRAKQSIGAIKRSIYFGSSLSLEEGSQLEHVEFLVRDQSKEA